MAFEEFGVLCPCRRGVGPKTYIDGNRTETECEKIGNVETDAATGITTIFSHGYA